MNFTLLDAKINASDFKREILKMCCTYTLIQDEKADLGQTELPGGYEVVQSSRCSHDNVNLIKI